MKKLILAMTVAAFTAGAFAGDACCEKAKAADKDKAGCADKSAAGCPAMKDAAKCPVAGEMAKKDAKPKRVESPKGSQASKS
jgi:hypothetical protein